MFRVSIGFGWYPVGTGFNDFDKPGRWACYETGGNTASELFNFLLVDLEYNIDRVVGCIAFLKKCLSGEEQPGVVGSGNDGALYFGGGHVLMASDYVDDERVVMTAEQFLLVLERVRDSMMHPDYRNPDNNPFEPFEVEIIASGEDSLNEYYKRGGVTPIMPGDES